jgi:hypothetical protein
MIGVLVQAAVDTARGVGRALRRHPGAFLATALGVLVANLLLPPLILSLARKPADYFTLNPWLRRLPEYLGSAHVPLGTKLEKTWNLALFWFSADNPYGVEWGFAVTVADLARLLLLSLLVGAYVALWQARRALGSPGGRPAGVLGALAGGVGLSTGPCSVVGCGAPVIPVLGLAFTGLSSVALRWMAGVSTVATAAVLAGLVLMVAWLGRAVGARGR